MKFGNNYTITTVNSLHGNTIFIYRDICPDEFERNDTRFDIQHFGNSHGQEQKQTHAPMD